LDTHSDLFLCIVNLQDIHFISTIKNVTALPTKSEDEMGQATPELIITSREEQEIAITGQGFMGQYTPLSHGNLAEKLTLE